MEHFDTWPENFHLLTLKGTPPGRIKRPDLKLCFSKFESLSKTHQRSKLFETRSVQYGHRYGYGTKSQKTKVNGQKVKRAISQSTRSQKTKSQIRKRSNAKSQTSKKSNKQKVKAAKSQTQKVKMPKSQRCKKSRAKSQKSFKSKPQKVKRKTSNAKR